jgi:hypothetical protein
VAPKEGVLVTLDKRAGRQVEDQAAVHLGVEVEVEVVEVFLRIAKLGLFAPAFQQAVTAPR